MVVNRNLKSLYSIIEEKKEDVELRLLSTTSTRTKYYLEGKIAAYIGILTHLSKSYIDN